MRLATFLLACLLTTGAHALPAGMTDQNNQGGLQITYVEAPSITPGQTSVYATLHNPTGVMQAYNLFLADRLNVAAGAIYEVQVFASRVSAGPVFQIGYHHFDASDVYVGEGGTNFLTNQLTQTSFAMPVPDITVAQLTHRYTVVPPVTRIQPRVTVYDIGPGVTMTFNVISFISGPAVGVGGGAGGDPPTVLTSTLNLTSAHNGQTFNNYQISTTSGNCVSMVGVTNVTFQNSRVGPCQGQGINIDNNSTNVKIYDNYIHVDNLASGCCDTRDGVKIAGTSSFVTVKGNVIAYNESNIRIQGGANNITVDGNFLLNPRGPFPRGQHLQAEAASNITVQYNYGLSTQSGHTFNADQEDAINSYNSSSMIAQFNFIQGGDSPSGCAFLCDDRSTSCQFNDNTMYNTGQCGIGIATGTNVQVRRNKLLSLEPSLRSWQLRHLYLEPICIGLQQCGCDGQCGKPAPVSNRLQSCNFDLFFF